MREKHNMGQESEPIRENSDMQNEKNNTSNEVVADCAYISHIYDQIETERFTPGILGGIVIDVPGIQGGTFTRLRDALRIGGRIVVPNKLFREYQDTLRVYYGNFSKEGEFYVAQKQD